MAGLHALALVALAVAVLAAPARAVDGTCPDPNPLNNLPTYCIDGALDCTDANNAEICGNNLFCASGAPCSILCDDKQLCGSLATAASIQSLVQAAPSTSVVLSCIGDNACFTGSYSLKLDLSIPAEDGATSLLTCAGDAACGIVRTTYGADWVVRVNVLTGENVVAGASFNAGAAESFTGYFGGDTFGDIVLGNKFDIACPSDGAFCTISCLGDGCGDGVDHSSDCTSPSSCNSLNTPTVRVCASIDENNNCCEQTGLPTVPFQFYYDGNAQTAGFDPTPFFYATVCDNGEWYCPNLGVCVPPVDPDAFGIYSDECEDYIVPAPPALAPEILYDTLFTTGAVGELVIQEDVDDAKSCHIKLNGGLSTNSGFQVQLTSGLICCTARGLYLDNSCVRTRCNNLPLEDGAFTSTSASGELVNGDHCIPLTDTCYTTEGSDDVRVYRGKLYQGPPKPIITVTKRKRTTTGVIVPTDKTVYAAVPQVGVQPAYEVLGPAGYFGCLGRGEVVTDGFSTVCRLPLNCATTDETSFFYSGTVCFSGCVEGF